MSSHPVYYLTAHSKEGWPVYYFLAVPPAKLPILLHDSSQRQHISVSEYGNVVASGHGEASARLVRQLRKNYTLMNI